MKIAVAFFGLSRCSSVCFPSIQEKILSKLPSEANIKYFYHLYEQVGIDNPRSGERGLLLENENHIFLSMHGMLEKPGDCLSTWNFGELTAYGDTWNDDFKSLKNLVHQLNSLNKVTEQVKTFDPDVVIFLRPDLFYHDELSIEFIYAAAKFPSAIFLPGWQSHKGYNDRFAVCGKNSYQSYGARAYQMKQYCQTYAKGLYAEGLLRYAIDQNAWIYPIKLRATRVRLGGIFSKERFRVGPEKYFQISGCLKRILIWLFLMAYRPGKLDFVKNERI
jgi:hypothetical protein